MERPVAVLLVVALTLVTFTPSHTRAQKSHEGILRRSERAIPNQYIVVFNEAVWRAAVAETARALADAWGGGTNDVFTINPDGGGEVRLTPAASYDYTAEWSPDGTRITFSTNESGYERAYVMNSDGSGRVRITNMGSQNRDPRWQPL